MHVMVNDTTLYFDIEGAQLVPDGLGLHERPTVIALHGGPGFDHLCFKPFLSPLADTAQVIYLDLRGQGRSGRPPIPTCTLEQMADDVAAFCEVTGIERPVILGHSAGGFVALHVAVRDPALIDGLILVCTAAATAGIGDAMGRLEQRRGPEARAAGERVFGGDFSAEAMEAFNSLVLPAYVYDPAAAGDVFAALGRCSFSPDVATFYFQERAAHYDLRDRLSEISVPALIVVGEDDWLCPPVAAREIADGIHGADILVVPEAGHFAYGEQPETVLNAVRHFLSDVRPV